MIRTSLIALASLAVSASAFACPGTGLQIKMLTLNADGTVTRSVYVKKQAVPEDLNPTIVHYVPVVRDRISLVQGDVVTLNASPTMIDSSLTAEITLKSQDRDAQGVLSTTYHVVETAKSAFGGINTKAIKTAYLATVKSNYLGNGTFSRGCGEVIKTDLDLESTTDARH